MASTRLTHAMRESAVKAAMAHRFDKEEAALCADAHAFGLRAWDFLMQGQAEKLAALPAHWFPSNSSEHIDFSALRSPFRIGWDEKDKHTIKLELGLRSWGWPVIFGKDIPIPYCLYRSTPKIKNDCPLWSEAEALAQRADKFISDMHETQAKLSGTLNAFTTVEKLVAAWPEIAPFLPSKAAPAEVPALPVVELNKLLGLP